MKLNSVPVSSILIVCYSLMLSHSVLAQNLLVTAEPRSILKGLTESLFINCTFNKSDDSSLVSLKVSRAQNSETIGQGYEELASVNSFSAPSLGNQNHENFTAAWSLAATGSSFLTLTWNRSLDIKQGAYKCDAEVLNITGQPFVVSNTAFVSGVSQESQMLVDEILKLREENKFRDAEFQSYKELVSSFIASWNRKMNQIQSSIFIESLEFNGSIYQLSRANVFDNTGIAKAVCEIFESRLTEIESSEELEFVQGFVKNNTDMFYSYYIVIGGINEGGVNGTWVSPYSNSPLGYLKWAAGYPAKNTYDTCLALWAAVGWDMVNVNCFTEPVDAPKKILCKHPVQK
uniref:C-type lectin domain-containing protein n=1 Tax=Biomphalaria glabrata TaxID=6526 RepID=A0A2C9KN56_BIOGL